jgi:hypothetical protein
MQKAKKIMLVNNYISFSIYDTQVRKTMLNNLLFQKDLFLMLFWKYQQKQSSTIYYIRQEDGSSNSMKQAKILWAWVYIPLLTPAVTCMESL